MAEALPWVAWLVRELQLMGGQATRQRGVTPATLRRHTLGGVQQSGTKAIRINAAQRLVRRIARWVERGAAVSRRLSPPSACWL